MLDTCTSSPMPTPRRVSYDAVVAKAWRCELWNASITTIGEDSTVLLTERLDSRAAVVDWVVAIAWCSRDGRDDAEIVTPDQDLRIA